MLLRKIKQVVIKILFKKGDDINHLLFLYNNNKSQLNRFLTMGQLTSGLMHDLFTPISSMVLIIDQLNKDGVLDDSELKNSLLSSKKELHNFTAMIHLYLKENDTNELVNISDTVEQSIRLLGYKIKENNIKVSFLRKNNHELFTNKLKLFQVITNIISNAINSHENSDKEKNINITISKRKNYISINILDNGSGISKDLIKKIYNPLFTTRKDGIGLGLSTTKRIVEKELGGKIKISSEINYRTNVLIKIPIRQSC